MNTLDQNLISSSVVIHRIIEDYDVHSMDFMTRIPTWICEALADLNIQQHLINVGKVIDFDEYRCEIPEGCENIRLLQLMVNVRILLLILLHLSMMMEIIYRSPFHSR